MKVYLLAAKELEIGLRLPVPPGVDEIGVPVVWSWHMALRGQSKMGLESCLMEFWVTGLW